jgi:hypothetical protein
MKVVTLLTLALAAAGAATAQAVDKFTAERMAEIYTGPRVRASMWIWSDKYVYQPGESLTLRWTVKPNNDLYPYTIFVYRQNNQTGAKTYYPALTSAPTDMNGNPMSQGFQPTVLQERTRAILLGSGGISPAVSVPSEPGMHTFVVELRDYTGTRPLKTAYMKIGVVTSVQTLSGDITADRTLTRDTQWNLQGIVFVKNNAVLTVEPGTFIIGQPGSQPPSALVVTRNGTIEAHGTRSRPIIMTSSQNFGQRQRGAWGGLVLLGRAPVNVAANAANSNPAGEFYIEGLQTTPDALYGGTDPTHYCGSLEYVRVEYAGSILSPNNELNSFTWGGCGTRTVAHHLQSIYGLDDAFEWFGGTMHASHLIGGLAADDYLDYQLGYTGKIQYALLYQSPDSPGNRGVEGDNSEFNAAAEPFSSPTMFNVSLIGSGVQGFDENTPPGIYLRRGTRGSFNNFVVTRFIGSGVFLNEAATQAQATAGNLTMNGILLWNNNIAGTNTGPTVEGNTQNNAAGLATLAFLNGAPAGGAQNLLAADPLLTRPFEYSDPDFAGLFGSPIFRAGWVQPPDDGFFDQSARFIGGIGDDDWTQEWTNFLVETDIQ